MRGIVAALVWISVLATPCRLYAQEDDVVMTLSSQADQLYQAGKYAEAIPIAERALAVLKTRYPVDDFHNGVLLGRLAEMNERLGRYGDAAPLYKRALAIAEGMFGPDNFLVSHSLLHLADMHRLLNEPDAEALYKRALAIHEKALGPQSDRVAGVLNALATLYCQQERAGEAEALFKRALAITEKANGTVNLDSGGILSNLGELYRSQGRLEEAERLLTRARDAVERMWGPDNIRLAAPLNNLAAVYADQGRLGEATAFAARVTVVTEKALGSAHPDLANSLNNLAELYRLQGRRGEAEPLLRRALAIYEKQFGPDHPSAGTPLNNLAALYQDEGRYAEAYALLIRAAAIYEKALGADHFSNVLILNNMASLHFAQGDWAKAARFWRKSADMIIRRTKRGAGLKATELAPHGRSEANRLGFVFRALVKASYREANGNAADPQLAARLFETAQWAHASEAARSLAQVAARQAGGGGALARLVRERQDLAGEWELKDKSLIGAAAQEPAQRNLVAEQAIRSRLSAIETRIAEIDAKLARDFHEHADLANPTPLGIAETQSLLAPDEALVLFLDTSEIKPAPEETFVWVVTRTSARLVRSELGTAALTREIQALRCGLDAAAWNGTGAGRCSAALGEVSRNDVSLPFDSARAHGLYRALFGQVEDLIRDKQLLLVPSGPLTQLPFHVLVTAPPDPGAGYRAAPWLARSHAAAVLPAVSSLKALRRTARPNAAGKTANRKPMIGFGDPLLNGDPSDPAEGRLARLARDRQQCRETASARLAALPGSRGGSAPLRTPRGLADVSGIRRLPPLPETADELCEVARRLHVDPAEIRLGERATEREVKALSASGQLAQYRIVHFATHGALAGQLDPGAEPGLILTPPAEAASEDDGYLTASEIAGLKLDADWVILSACNTAAGDAVEAEALSGLARAFFYAQARAVLVSHWEVNSAAAVKLVTSAIGAMAEDHRVGRAGAMRRAMLALIDGGAPEEAHPAYWAPFVVVGDGAR